MVLYKENIVIELTKYFFQTLSKIKIRYNKFIF